MTSEAVNTAAQRIAGAVDCRAIEESDHAVTEDGGLLVFARAGDEWIAAGLDGAEVQAALAELASMVLANARAIVRERRRARLRVV